MTDSKQHSERDNECPECREYDFPGYHDLVEQYEGARERIGVLEASLRVAEHQYEISEYGKLEDENLRLKEQLEALRSLLTEITERPVNGLWSDQDLVDRVRAVLNPASEPS